MDDKDRLIQRLKADIDRLGREYTDALRRANYWKGIANGNKPADNGSSVRTPDTGTEQAEPHSSH